MKANREQPPNGSSYLLVLTTHPDREGALALARQLLEQRLAACINILPAMRSVYVWEGRLESGEEHQLFIKTRAERYPALERAIAAHHPYEVPEILALPITRGLGAYLRWLDETTS